MKVSIKLFLGFIIISTLAATVGFTGIYSTNEVLNKRGSSEHFLEIDAGSQAGFYSKQAESHLLLYLTLEDNSEKEKFFARYNSLKDNIQTLEKIAQSPEEKELIKNLKSASDDILRIGTRLIEIHDSDPGGFDTKEHSQQLREFDDAALKVRDTGIELIKSETKENIAEATADSNASQQTILLVMGITGVTATFVFFYISHHILKKINEIKKITSEITKGNLDVQIKSQTNDELGDLLNNVNIMRFSIKRTINDLNQVMNTLDETALVSITDDKGNITYVNKEFCRVSKYSKEELLGQNHRIIKSGYHPPEFYKELWQIITSGKIWRGEIKNQAKDGTFYWVKSVIAPIFDGVSNEIIKYISIRTDITEQKELKERMIATERMSAIGELSARLAHDLRNPLSVIKNGLSIMRIKSPSIIQENEKIFGMFDRAINRISHQTDEVLDFVKPKPLSVSKFSLLEILNDIIEKTEIPKEIEITLPQNDVQMIADVGKLEIVFSNLISNAIQEMQTKGKIKIRVEDKNDLVFVEVEDTGGGIPQDVFTKIFDPLFTTRQVGTGLGLVSCKSIVEKHGGKISVQTELGKGTTFIIQLPKIPNSKGELGV